MERDEQWREEIRGQLEQISKYIRDLTPPRFHLGPQEPSLEAETSTMEQKLLVIYAKMEKGMRSLVNMIQDPAVLQAMGSEPRVIKALGEMMAVAAAVTNHLEPSLRSLAAGESLQSILQISDETLQSLYFLSRYLYEHQQYEEACGAFYLLSVINPSYTTFWIGLGNCEYLLQRYQEALSSYSFASQVESSNPTPQILAARCHLALGNLAAATACISIAELSCTDLASLAKVKKQAEQVRNDIRRSSL